MHFLYSLLLTAFLVGSNKQLIHIKRWCFKCVARSKIVQIYRCAIGEIFWQLTGKFVAHCAGMQMLRKMVKHEMDSNDTYAKTMIAA